MSWNNVIPWKMVECMSTCKRVEPDTGYIIHEEGCQIGEEIKERENNNNLEENDKNNITTNITDTNKHGDW